MLVGVSYVDTRCNCWYLLTKITKTWPGIGSGVCLLLRVCAVVLSLLLMAGDVERNPGPTDKEGTPTLVA